MTKVARDFNLKYDLNLTSKSFDKVLNKDYLNQELSGKPKKNILEIIKRFFSYPTYTIAFVVFLLLVLAAFILPSFSNYSENLKISANAALINDIENAPPTWDPIVTEIVNNNNLELLKNVQDKSDIALKILDTPSLVGNWVSYDKWKFLEYWDSNIFQGTSILGTDGSGIDFWSRLWQGLQNSIIFALVVSLATTAIGMTMGSFIGLYVGTWIDIIFMKILYIYNSIPTIVWYSMILYVLPPSPLSLYIVFLVTGWMRGLGVSRMYMWKYVNSDFMKSAEITGVSKFGRIFKHALPHYFGYVSYIFVQSIPAIISGEASLAFIGLSPNPTNASLGNVLNESRESILVIQENLILLLLPTLLIFSLTMSLHFVAMGINDALEPKFVGKR